MVSLGKESCSLRSSAIRLRRSGQATERREHAGKDRGPILIVMTIKEFLEESNKLIETNDSETFWVFRGLKLSSYSCDTSFSRLIKLYIKRIKLRHPSWLEDWHKQLCNDLRMELDDRAFEDKMVWQYIQHYHQKTNLLDVTTDPKIALKFALEPLKNNEVKEKSKFKECRVIAVKTCKQMYFAKQAHGENGYLVSLIDYKNYCKFSREEEPLPKSIDNINKKIKKQKGAFLYCKIPYSFDYERYFLSNKFIWDYDLNRRNIYSKEIFKKYKKFISSKINNNFRTNGYDAGIIKSFTITVESRKKFNDTYHKDKKPKIEKIINKYMEILQE